MDNMIPREALAKIIKSNKRSSRLEKIIAQDPESSFFYASHLNERFIEGEEAIIISVYHTHHYIEEIVRAPFPKGEKIISTEPFYSYRYAKNILKNVFHLAHPRIFNSSFKNDYINFLKSINYDLNEIGEWLI
jgi:hypothetical protein